MELHCHHDDDPAGGDDEGVESYEGDQTRGHIQHLEVRNISAPFTFVSIFAELQRARVPGRDNATDLKMQMTALRQAVLHMMFRDLARGWTTWGLVVEAWKKEEAALQN